MEKVSLINSKKNSLKDGVNVPMYSIKDEAIGFQGIFNVANDALAIRWFTEETNKKGSNLNKYPDENALWKVGYINDQTGDITPCKEKLITARQCLIPESANV